MDSNVFDAKAIRYILKVPIKSGNGIFSIGQADPCLVALT